jgi:hypothetical protein
MSGESPKRSQVQTFRSAQLRHREREERAFPAQHDLSEQLRRLLIAIEQLRQKSYIGPRERVAVARSELDVLQRSLSEIESLAERVGSSHSDQARFATAQVAALMASVTDLFRKRYRTPNWIAQVAMVWLRLRALAMVLTNIAPQTADALSLTLTGRPPAWPSLDNVVDVNLVAIPPGLAERDSQLCPPLVPALSGRDEPDE